MPTRSSEAHHVPETIPYPLHCFTEHWRDVPTFTHPENLLSASPQDGRLQILVRSQWHNPSGSGFLHEILLAQASAAMLQLIQSANPEDKHGGNFRAGSWRKPRRLELGGRRRAAAKARTSCSRG